MFSKTSLGKDLIEPSMKLKPLQLQSWKVYQIKAHVKLALQSGLGFLSKSPVWPLRTSEILAFTSNHQDLLKNLICLIY